MNHNSSEYYLVKERAVPEVLLKVLEAKKLLDTRMVQSVQEAADKVGISRSSFYKYQDDIFEFHDSSAGTTVTLSCQMNDEPGLLSDVLKVIADFGANILTIHQAIPVNGVATLTLSMQMLQSSGDVSDMIADMEERKGVFKVRILGKG